MPSRVRLSVPASAPAVLMALMRETCRVRSPAPLTASVSGKLAPQSSVAGNSAIAQRSASKANAYDGVTRTHGRKSFVGCHSGNAFTIIQAPKPIAAASSS